MENLEAAHRNFITTRLEVAKLCESIGNSPWVTVQNHAYKSCINPCVSVIITLFNYSDHILECLNSVCASKNFEISELEILVIDDCSTDNSARLVENYISQCDLPICLVKKLFNTGLADARNVGLKLSRSPYVFILDADNWIYPRCLTTLYSAIKNSEYAAVYGIVNRFNDCNGESLGLLSYYEWDVNELVREPYIDAMAMFNREVLLELGGYSTELMAIGWFGWEDYDLWLKIAQANYSCKLVPQILSSYRCHPNSMINTTNKYVPNIVKHFKRKFSSLIRKYEPQHRVFGVSGDLLLQTQPQQQNNTELEQTQWQLQQTKTQLEQTQWQLQQTQQNLYLTQVDLEQAKTRITAMESSKFWKLRTGWFRIKRLTGLPINE